MLSLFSGLQAQDNAPLPKRPKKNLIKFSPFHLIEETYLISYERMFAKNRLSVMVSPGINYRPGKRTILNSDLIINTPEKGYQGELQLRFYAIKPSNKSMEGKGGCYFKGLYAGPYVMYRYREREMAVYDYFGQTQIDDQQRVSEWAGGAIVGTQIAFGNVFLMELYVGVGKKESEGGFYFNRSYTPGISSYFSPGYSGWLPNCGFQLGVAF